uniref:TRPM SLOG domain-containing protein n=1 Tax=Plectus sambesii TaxID=2011161 RepID=A0A914UQR0_9BILA
MAHRKQSDELPLDQQSEKQVAMNIDPILASGGSPLKFEDKFRHFARSTLLQRECSSFVPKTLKDNGATDSESSRTCYCGRSELWHQNKNVNIAADPRAGWIPETHTKVKPTAAYGRIEFTGFGNQTESSCYGRVDHCTSPETLWTLLSDVWNLPTPKLVLSVTGGAKHFNMKPRLANAFKQGLIDVASST